MWDSHRTRWGWRLGLATLLPLMACASGLLPAAQATQAHPSSSPPVAPGKQSAVASAPSSTAAVLPPGQEGARVVPTAIARKRPDPRAHAVQRVWPNTGFSNRAPVLPVLGHASDERGSRWLRVRLPERPNGATRWIPASRTRPVRLPWRVEVDLSQRAARVYRLGRPLRAFSVVIGKPGTPTPRGHFFIVDRLRLETWWAPGTRALMLSAYSETFQVTRLDPGQIALHSRGVLPDPLGSAASHGCVRFAQRDINWLLARLPNGTPVDVHR